jgi:hypothetical protein
MKQRLQKLAKISVNETPPARPQKYKKHTASQTFMLLVRREVDAPPTGCLPYHSGRLIYGKSALFYLL